MSLARKTGILYLLVAVLAPFTMLYVPTLLFVPGDMLATTNNVIDNEMLLRTSIAIGTGVFIVEIILTAYVYKLFESVHRTLSLAAAFARLAMTTIQGINIIFRLLTIDAAYSGDANLLGMSLNAHEFGVYAWQLFFGLHLIILGYLAFKSGFVPKLLGCLVVAGSLGYLADSYAGILALNSHVASTTVSVLLAVSTIGEISFMLWLLIKGNKSFASLKQDGIVA